MTLLLHQVTVTFVMTHGHSGLESETLLSECGPDNQLVTAIMRELHDALHWRTDLWAT